MFHIPVMGTGFTIDTAIRVARYGISSVMSLVDDVLVEQLRKYHCQDRGLPYAEICENDEDSRANRITAYLNLINDEVNNQIDKIRSSPFVQGSEITRYYEMLPDSPLRQSYLDMLATDDQAARANQQETLRSQVVPGSIDVNIMTKLDRDLYRNGEKLPKEAADAMAALRGYANSSVESSIVFSAGMNQRLYSYLAEFKDFLPDESGYFRKKITLKVSDFRSALIQGKFLAKRGLWVSEYRVESGLNCGGHAFGLNGNLLGPILEEFNRNSGEFASVLQDLYARALTKRGLTPIAEPHPIRITVQGGVGTAEEHNYLLDKYPVDSIGWGTPFLLVPEVVRVDDVHLNKLVAAGEEDVHLSDRSPLGIPFWSLRSSASEEARMRRITKGKPGSACPKGFLVLDTEFTKVPICRASRTFQRRKLKQIDSSTLSADQQVIERESVITKACICHELGGAATVTLGIDPEIDTAVCCGPNIINFSKVATLEEMVGHIYGRTSLMTNPDRPHMFIAELKLCIDDFRAELQKVSDELMDKSAKHFQEFRKNLVDGIEYYRSLAEQISADQQERFLEDLDSLFAEIESIFAGC
ncbi:MAG: hypothetical protein V3T31_04445, partial [candidate division Zixibacteria bacterium]